MATRRYLVACALFFASVFAFAGEDSANTISYGEMGVLQDYADPGTKTGHVAMRSVIGALQPYFDAKQDLQARTGINYIIEYAPLYQKHMDGSGGSTAGDEANFILKWSPEATLGRDRGALLAWYQYQNTWTERNTSEFMQRMGVLSPLNGGVSGPGNQSTEFLQHFAWEYRASDAWSFMFGKMTTRALMNLNRFAVSDREDFFSPMLVNNPVVHYTARLGLGAFGRYQADEWYLAGLARQAGGTSQWFALDELHVDELEYLLEFAATPSNAFGLGKGNYRFTPSWTDAVGKGEERQPSGWTLSFSADQDIGDSLGLLFRYAYASESFRQFRQRLSVGAQLKQPLGYQNDRIGLAAWWGEPSERRLDSEQGLEAFWKIQVAPFMELSADLQLVVDPVLDDSDYAWVGGLRLRLVF